MNTATNTPAVLPSDNINQGFCWDADDTDQILYLARCALPRLCFRACSFDDGLFYLEDSHGNEFEVEIADGATFAQIEDAIIDAVNDAWGAASDSDAASRSERRGWTC